VAIKIYRFALANATTKLAGRVRGTVTAGPVTGAPTQDVTFDDRKTNGTDVIDAMQDAGWAFQSDVTP
jgi:hypothetical protein